MESQTEFFDTGYEFVPERLVPQSFNVTAPYQQTLISCVTFENYQKALDQNSLSQTCVGPFTTNVVNPGPSQSITCNAFYNSPWTDKEGCAGKNTSELLNTTQFNTWKSSCGIVDWPGSIPIQHI